MELNAELDRFKKNNKKLTKENHKLVEENAKMTKRRAKLQCKIKELEKENEEALILLKAFISATPKCKADKKLFKQISKRFKLKIKKL